MIDPVEEILLTLMMGSTCLSFVCYSAVLKTKTKLFRFQQTMDVIWLVTTSSKMFWTALGRNGKEMFCHMCFYKKWRDTNRNFEKDDIVLLEDQNTVRRCWKLGRIREVYPVRDGLVGDVEFEVVAKNGFKTSLSRPIQKLVLILPKDEKWITGKH